MADYIKREDAKNMAIDFVPQWDEESRRRLLVAMNTIPAADVVEVVRCRDCERSREDTFYQVGVGYVQSLACKYGQCNDSAVDEDFFCKHGKRKETNDER